MGYGAHLDVREANATGAMFTASDAGMVLGLAGARLVANGADAEAVLRETDGSGKVLARLSAIDGEADSFFPPRPVAFRGTLHVTIAGAGATVQAYL
jgi:hypothetical protein